MPNNSTDHPKTPTKMKIVPIDLKTANNFVETYHRHNKKVRGCKFCIGLQLQGELIGVGIAGRPVARMLDNGKRIEILRVCVKEGNPTACSKIYGRIKQIAQLMGYDSIITYTLKKESQSSLKAVAAVAVAEIKGRQWKRNDGFRAEQKVFSEDKIRYELGVAVELPPNPQAKA